MTKQIVQTSMAKMTGKAYLFLSLFFLVFTNPITAQTNQPQLKLKEPIKEKIIQGRAKNFSLNLEKEQFARLRFGRYSAQVKMKLYDLNNRLIDETEPPRRNSESRICFVSKSAGAYRIEVEVTSKDFDEAEFVIELEALRLASSNDVELSRAEKLFSEADALRFQEEASVRRTAIAKYEEALTLFTKAQEKARQAETLRSISYIFRSLGDFQKAIAFYDRALPLFRELGDKASVAELTNRKAESYYSIGEYVKCLALLQEALSLFKEVGDAESELDITLNLAVLYSAFGESRKALELFKEVMSKFEAAGNKQRLGTAYSNIGSIYDDIGEPQEALNYYNKSLQVRRETKDLSGQIKTLNNISTVYNAIGEIQKALESLNEALELSRKVGDKNLEATALGNLGVNYDELGDRQRAKDFFEKSLAINRETGNKIGEAYSLLRTGTVAATDKSAKEALDLLLRALALFREMRDEQGESRALIRVGEVYDLLGDKSKAFEHLNQALSLLKKSGDKVWEAYVLEKLARLSNANGDRQKAAEYYNQALTLSRAIFAKRTETSILYGLSQLERDNGNLTKAREYLELTIEKIEGLRSGIVRGDLRTSLLSSTQKVYETYISLLMEMHAREPKKGFDAFALQANEKARARGLLEALEETRKNIRQGVSAELPEREKLLQQAINSKESYRTQLSLANAAKEKIEDANREIRELLNQYQETLAEIRAKSPHYASLTQPRTFNLEEIQKEILDTDTVLLEYSLGEKRSFLFLATQNSLSVYELPQREKIETAARILYELMTARTQIIERETPVQRQTRIRKADEDFKIAANELGKMLSIQAIWQTKAKRLLIVADGGLQYLPFGVLSSSQNRDVYSPLLSEFEIVSAASASTIGALREELKEKVSPPKSIAVFADPVFGKNDLRLQSKPKDANSLSQTDDRTGNLVRLRFSRQEADYISQLTTPQERFIALDFAANRNGVQSTELSQYRIIHFATHGFLDSRNPELSGLVFSRVDEKGNSVEGYLRLHEIYNLKLNANLVVLSACQTALGKEIRGEGLIGLTRGFMYAGVPSVAASLWRVDDRATAELMKRFYQMILKDKMRPSTALRLAQLSLMQDARWSAPYYWASFVLQGEWR